MYPESSALYAIAQYQMAVMANAKQGRQTSYPVKAEQKSHGRKRFGHVYFVEDERERVLFHRREEKGLLGGMLGLPTTEWDGDAPDPTVSVCVS